ncbi:putative membrane protein [Helicobacter pylori Hp P-11b]|uniref:Putative membrane protein n=1 Tax=Helicobacter pylori Hp P-11b TaxID=992106 RepID=J0S2T5_HELPX|nr:putative membrane protein [Helicobacter pylori Hp P-11]EJC29761.1 putative membrane protein [Helicobacter pylori Hp P-11b]
MSVQCFLVFLSFWHGLFLLVVGWAFFNAPLFLSDRII